MRIDAKTPFWVVNDPLGPHSTLPDVCFATDLAGLRLQFAGGLSMDQRPALFTTQEEAYEEAMNRLLVWKVARQIRNRPAALGGGGRAGDAARQGRGRALRR